MRARISEIKSNYVNDEFTKKFIEHNSQIFRKFEAMGINSKVLIELNDAHSNHIAYSYFANVLSKKYSAEICGYSVSSADTIKEKIRWIISKFLNLRVFAVYRSFGANSFIIPKLGILGKISAWQTYRKIYKEIKTKRDIENIAINGVLIGDLIYDSYLRKYSYPTIHLEDIFFKKFLHNSIKLFIYWGNYFSKINVAAIMVSHCVYINAIPLRIALARKIPGYQVTAKDLYYLDQKNSLAYIEFLYFKEKFRELKESHKNDAFNRARLRIERRLTGEVGVDLAYSKKSAFGEFKEKRIIVQTEKIKVLIATHCFFDSPHGYGGNLFPDLYEWIDFLGKISLETNYDWYIKTHPDYLPGTMEIIKFFSKKYPKLVIIPADSSHRQIIAEGINFALTVYGSIGIEYAALDVPVINASCLNPHVSYDFNLHPKTVNEYEKILLNLDKINFEIDKNQVYEYYFMKNILNQKSWIFNDYDNCINRIGGYSAQFTSHIYQEWLKEWSENHHTEVLFNINNFLNSKNYKLDVIDNNES